MIDLKQPAAVAIGSEGPIFRRAEMVRFASVGEAICFVMEQLDGPRRDGARLNFAGNRSLNAKEMREIYEEQLSSAQAEKTQDL